MTTSCLHGTDIDVFFSTGKVSVHPFGIRYHDEPGTCLALVDIFRVQAMHEQNTRPLFAWLSEEEQDYIRRFRFPKRYYEWLCGRIAAKAALLHQANFFQRHCEPGAITILADDHGRPRFIRPQDICRRQLSISHSNRYAVAMITCKSCGVDIQRIESRIVKLGDHIATDREIRMATGALGSLQEGLTLLWAAKEALKKCCLYDRPGLFKSSIVERISLDQGNGRRLRCRLVDSGLHQDVRVALVGGYMLAWCGRGNDAGIT